jgi:hypothetical protein
LNFFSDNLSIQDLFAFQTEPTKLHLIRLFSGNGTLKKWQTIKAMNFLMSGAEKSQVILLDRNLSKQ